jgi:DNA-3-methyladenine glycosylase
MEGFPGPGRLGRELQLDRSFYGEDLVTSERMWIEEGERPVQIQSGSRIGIHYAGEPWVSNRWRFFINGQTVSARTPD